MSGYLYRVPDGSDDTPDENGQHTATVNVHSAELAARFTGCKSCQTMVRLQAESDAHVVHGEWWNETEGWHILPGVPVRYVPDVAARLDAAVHLGYVTADEAQSYRALDLSQDMP